MTVKHWDVLLWKVKISSDKDATRQARQSCQHRFNYNWSCLWAGEMDWISSSWAVGRHWRILGGLDKAPGEFNLIFLLLPTFFPESSLWKLCEECSIYPQPAGQEGSGAIGSTPPKGTLWTSLVASWVDTCCMFLAFPRRKRAELSTTSLLEWKSGCLCIWRAYLISGKIRGQ